MQLKSKQNRPSHSNPTPRARWMRRAWMRAIIALSLVFSVPLSCTLSPGPDLPSVGRTSDEVDNESPTSSSGTTGIPGFTGDGDGATGGMEGEGGRSGTDSGGEMGGVGGAGGQPGEARNEDAKGRGRP